MLTLNRNVTFNSLNPICKYTDGLSRRIIGNYMQIEARLQPEDLLHLVTQPAEILFEGGSMTTLINDTRITNNINTKMEVLNELMNRIMVANQTPFTYQDRVFIQNTLQKLGVTDVNRFMKQVFLLQQDSVQTNELLHLYNNNVERLQQLILKDEQGKREAVHSITERGNAGPEISYLQSSGDEYISNENVNQEALGFTKNSIINSNTVLMESQQKAEAEDKKQKTSTHEMEEETGRKGSEVYYLQKSIYDRLQTESIYEEINRISKNYSVNESMITRQELQLAEHRKTFESLILNKFRNELRDEEFPITGGHINVYEYIKKDGDVNSQTKILSQVNTALLLNLADNLFSVRVKEIIQKNEEHFDIVSAFYQSTANSMERLEQTQVRNEEFIEQSEKFLSQRNDTRSSEISLLHQVLDNSIVNQPDTLNSTYSINEGNRFIESSIYHNEQGSREAEHIDTERTLERVENIGEQVTEVIRTDSKEYYEKLREQLDVINKENIRKYHELQQMPNGDPLPKGVAVDRERAIKDSLRALNNPQELVLDYLQGTTQIEEMGQARQEQLEAMMTPETKEIFRRFEEMRRSPNEMMKRQAENMPSPEQFRQDMKRLISSEQNMNLEYLTRENVEEKAEQVSEVTQDITQKLHTAKTQANETIQSLNLVHKKTEDTISEDVIQELRKQNYLLQRKNETNTELHEIEHREVKSINTIQTGQVLENHVEVNDVIKNSIQDQMGQISDQVYKRIEKRLDTERKRRGR